MVGLVVAAHGRLAQELVATAEQIMGPVPDVATVSIEPGTSPETIRAQMRAAVKENDHGEGVLVLADLFGGTPCKESLLLCGKANVEVLAGVNLPMLMKAASLRKEHLPLHDLAESLYTYAQRNIRFASELVRSPAGRHVAPWGGRQGGSIQSAAEAPRHRDLLPAHRRPPHPRTGGGGLAAGPQGRAGCGRRR